MTNINTGATKKGINDILTELANMTNEFNNSKFGPGADLDDPEVYNARREYMTNMLSIVNENIKDARGLNASVLSLLKGKIEQSLNLLNIAESLN